MPRFTHKLAAAFAAATMFVPAIADAQPWGGRYDGYSRYDRGYDDVRYRGHRGGGYGNYGYGYGRGYGAYDGRDYRRNYRGGRGYCRDKGTGGTLLGAIAGGLLGNEVAGRGDRTAGAIVGAGVGALAGRAIDRNC